MVVVNLFKLMPRRMISLCFSPPKYATFLGISKNNYNAKALYHTILVTAEVSLSAKKTSFKNPSFYTEL